MAGNVTAFATVWTYDIYRPYFRKARNRRALCESGALVHHPGRVDQHRGGVFCDPIQEHHGLHASPGELLYFAPFFGTVLMGMLWKRATSKGGFWGLLAGSVSSVAMFTLVKVDPSKIAWIALSPHAKDMAENLYRALWSFLICVAVTVIVSLLHQTENGGRVERAGLRIYRHPLRRPHALLQAPVVLGHRRWRVLRNFAVDILVGARRAVV
jgi:SSS family solute:Na+ symporter